MSNAQIKRLQHCRYPLLMLLIVSGGLVIRTPLLEVLPRSAASEPKRPPANSTADDSELAAAPKETADDEARSDTRAALAGTSSSAGNPEEPVDAADQTGAPSIAEARQALQSQLRLFTSVYEALPRFETAEDRPAAGESTAGMAPDSAEEREGLIVLRNHRDSGGRVLFLVDRTRHTLEPGEEIELPSGTQIRVRFHRGASFGNADQSISTAGVFEFVPTVDGWQLVPEGSQ